MRCKLFNVRQVGLSVLVILTCGTTVIRADDAAPPATAPPTTAPATAYERGLALLAAGKQADAEHLLADHLDREGAGDPTPSAAEEVFFLAVCRRSRFEVEIALPLFRYVGEALHDSPHARAARLIAELDGGSPNPDVPFAELDRLSAQHPDDPMMLWMVAVQCRSLEKPAIGVERYKKLCQMWQPAPVLVHQTYANLLDDLDRCEESLIHRRIAVKLEPASWAYQGLGNTLTKLHRWKEADEAFIRCTTLDPYQRLYWRNWAYSMELRGDLAGARRMKAKAAALNKPPGGKL